MIIQIFFPDWHWDWISALIGFIVGVFGWIIIWQGGNK
jgi:hypothetical protein